MLKKQLKRKTWIPGDVLEKGELRVVVSKVDEKTITYLYGWLVQDAKNVFPNDPMLKNGWKKIDFINNYSTSNLKKSKYFHIQKGVCIS